MSITTLNVSQPLTGRMGNMAYHGVDGASVNGSTLAALPKGKKYYEMKDHLGNMRVLLSDQLSSSGSAQVKAYNNYYPFGMMMPGRNEPDLNYRFGFQGQEKDDEIKGTGNSINYKFRVYDTRIGRLWSIDPLRDKYPSNSPYAFSENRVIDGIELEGAERYPVNRQWYRKEVGERAKFKGKSVGYWNNHASQQELKQVAMEVSLVDIPLMYFQGALFVESFRTPIRGLGSSRTGATSKLRLNTESTISLKTARTSTTFSSSITTNLDDFAAMYELPADLPRSPKGGTWHLFEGGFEGGQYLPRQNVTNYQGKLLFGRGMGIIPEAPILNPVVSPLPNYTGMSTFSKISIGAGLTGLGLLNEYSQFKKEFNKSMEEINNRMKELNQQLQELRYESLPSDIQYDKETGSTTYTY